MPSLNRPTELKKFFDYYLKAKSTIPVWVLVDHEDPRKEEYQKIEYPEGSVLMLTQSRTMGDKIHEVFEQYKDHDAIMILNDDHRPITEEWDKKVLEQINGHNCVFTNDGEEPSKPWNAPHRICGAITISGAIIRALGYVWPREIKHLYTDEALGFIFNHAKNASCLMEVCVWHQHAYKHENKRDETYKAINGDADFTSPEAKGGMWEADRAAFQRWINESAQEDAQKVLDLQPKMGVMIATPCQDHQVSMNYALGLSDATVTMAMNNVYFEISRVAGSSLLPHARNSLVDMFLKSRCQRLLMVDADQGWGKDSIFRLLQSPKLIVGGITPHKRFPINFNFKPLKEDEHYFKDLVNKSPEEFMEYAKAKADPLGLIEVEHIGTGFLMIDREVFNILKDQVGEYVAFDNNDRVKHKEFFEMSGKTGHYKGEDWFFCELAKKNKIPLYINANVILSHLGAHEFRP